MTDPVGLGISSPSQPHRLHSEERMSAHTIGDDTILGGIEGDLIDGDVGNDTLFEDWEMNPLTVAQKAALDAYWSANTPEAARVANKMMLAAGLPDANGFYADGKIAASNTETIIIDGRLWRIVHLKSVEFIDNGKARRLVEVEEV